MSLFSRPAENQAKLYVKGLEKGDMRIDKEDKLKGMIKVTVGEDGTLLSKGAPLHFLRSLLVSLPDSLVDYSYPHTIMVDKNQTLKIKPALWLLLNDNEREEMIGALSGEHEITIREFRILTR
jgi:hypothetical protein